MCFVSLVGTFLPAHHHVSHGDCQLGKQHLTLVFPCPILFKASGRNEFTGTTDFQSVAWCYSTDWKSVVQIADGKFYPAARLKTLSSSSLRIN